MLTLASRLAGDALALPFAVVAAVRRDKPIHEDGAVVAARVERSGAPSRWGSPWLDEPGVDSGLVRFSRTLGTPQGWPDVFGLALRFTDAAGTHDLVLATTGMAPLARHLFRPHRTVRSDYGSLLPYVTATGPVLLAARPLEDNAFSLEVASPLGAWERFATLHVSAETTQSVDGQVAFDPVLHPLPGLAFPAVVQGLRGPSYAAARAGRRS
jgi:hypothetical protein